MKNNRIKWTAPLKEEFDKSVERSGFNIEKVTPKIIRQNSTLFRYLGVTLHQLKSRLQKRRADLKLEDPSYLTQNEMEMVYQLLKQ